MPKPVDPDGTIHSETVERLKADIRLLEEMIAESRALLARTEALVEVVPMSPGGDEFDPDTRGDPPGNG